jgi:hypothetical protein
MRVPPGPDVGRALKALLPTRGWFVAVAERNLRSKTLVAGV